MVCRHLHRGHDRDRVLVIIVATVCLAILSPLHDIRANGESRKFFNAQPFDSNRKSSLRLGQLSRGAR